MGKNVVEPTKEIVNMAEIVRSKRKEEIGVDYFLNELVGKEIVILSVDVGEQVFEALVDGKKVRVAYRGAVAVKRLKAVYDVIKAANVAVKAKVIRRESRAGRTYVDLV